MNAYNGQFFNRRTLSLSLSSGEVGGIVKQLPGDLLFVGDTSSLPVIPYPRPVVCPPSPLSPHVDAQIQQAPKPPFSRATLSPHLADAQIQQPPSPLSPHFRFITPPCRCPDPVTQPPFPPCRAQSAGLLAPPLYCRTHHFSTPLSLSLSLDYILVR